MDTLIHTINKLQDVFSVIGHHDINLPQIVVVGTQTSGKSSVIESLVGKSFLPRGTGIVTRAPLVLQMIRYSNRDREEMVRRTENRTATEWAIFLDRPDEIFVDFDAVRDEIERRTEQMAEHNKGITHEQIVLKLYTRLYDLTFVDLPGMTMTSAMMMGGDQSQNIDKRIPEIIWHYVKQPNSIILAIVSATADTSTSDSWKIARKMDPNGTRTIAVVTKLDLVDKNTFQQIINFLCGNRNPLKLGVIGVINRSQEDINRKKSIKETLRTEKEFLKANYPENYKRHGNRALACHLQRILINHIKETYPVLKKQLYDLRSRLNNELRVLETPVSKVSFVLDLLKDMSGSYCETIRGDRKNISEQEMTGGAKIENIVQHDYMTELKNIDPLHDLTDQKIMTILKNTSATNASLFINEKTLKKLISRQIQMLVEPSLTCVDKVHIEMLKIFDTIDQDILEKLARFSQLNHDVRKVLGKILGETLDNIKWFIRSYIETYQESVNTYNTDFMREILRFSNQRKKERLLEQFGPNVKLSAEYNEYEEDPKELSKQMLATLNNLEDTSNSTKEVKAHRILVECYFVSVRKIVQDFVPKRIKYKMLQKVLDTFESRMHQEVFVPYVVEQAFDRVLVEEESVKEDRVKAEEMLKAVDKALNIMVEIQII
ncbi:Dynamin GTPase effector,Dynamin-type guanine nucleotide-binding (G) domain,Dynamin, GTPase region [Cinara cedri]|uniref:Dynamin GTPase effector,Dynamin-type guanine nucleotide-binding (G) domain,Dynamin, GTPase region n=1 Tax=Cinara cedri TaxID=506608 RepID=A0A5E4NJX3_9HEMI|nr:Dynamin GTPase effector,Dynamin-type guanine nucleotide-binding (G) domain,Dynamin, GTPase region [Cinara cedri]